MANWTPNNSEAINSASLDVWLDASNTNGYVTDGSTTEDDDYGIASNITTINNLGTTGYTLTPITANYPTLRTGSLPGHNGFKFGNLDFSWTNTAMQSTNAGITSIRNNEDRMVFSVVSNVSVNGVRGNTFKGMWGWGDFGLRQGFSVFADTNSNRDSPVLSFTFSDHASTTANLFSDPPNKAIITAQNSSSVSNTQNLFFNTIQEVAATETLATTVSSAGAGLRVGSSNYSADTSDYVLHELLIYSVADSGEDADNFRNIVEGYLAHKWEITDLLPADHPYKSAAPQIGGGGGVPVFGNDRGFKFNVNPEGASDGPLINRFEAINSNYGKSGNIEQIPFTLQQPGVFSIKRRSIAYKATRGDSNE